MDEAARRRELRRIARRLHPDVGGDPDRYVAAVEALEREARGGRRAFPPVEVRPAAGLRGLVRRARRLWRAWARERVRRRRRAVDERLGAGRVRKEIRGPWPVRRRRRRPGEPSRTVR